MMLPKPTKRKGKSKRAKAVDIPSKIRITVWERDKGRCIICGSHESFPNAHYLPRSAGGRGIEQNIVTLCLSCHHFYDNGGLREEIGQKIESYLKSKYKNWNKEDLIYKKG